MTSTPDFAAEITAAQASPRRDEAVAKQRALREAWARSLLGLATDGELVSQVRERVEGGLGSERAAEAIEQLHEAEQHQWEIGTWATGSGEGLASMFEVRTLQLAQAWLWSTRIEHDARERARTLLREVVDDPNQIAARLSSHMEALARRLG